MRTITPRQLLAAMISLLILLGPVFCAQAEWGPPGGQQTQTQRQYPSFQPPAQGRPDQPGLATSLSDALGRFRVNLPSGAVPVTAMYSFNVPSAMCQVSIMSIAQDLTFQMQQQNFINVVRQMNGTIDAEQPMEVNGRQAQFLAATMQDQSSGMSMHSMNVFIGGAGIWVQVMGAEQNVQRISEIFNSILAEIQF